MDGLSKELSKVDEKVTDLRNQFERCTSEAAKLKVELNKAQETIQAAESLISKLDNEYKRWSSQMDQLANEMRALPLRAMIAAGFICYLGSAPEDARAATLKLWTKNIMQGP